MEDKYTAARNPQQKSLACQTFRGMVRNGKNGKKEVGMLTTLSSICGRIARKHAIVRRRRRKTAVAGLIAELNELEVRLENAVLSDERLIKDNHAIIQIFYNNVELAKHHYRRGNKDEVDASLAEARSTVICIERNARACREHKNVQYVIN